MDKVEAQLRRKLQAAQEKSDKATTARRMLPPGSSRAKVTTANARWSRAAEARDRAQNALDDPIEALTEAAKVKPEAAASRARCRK